MDTRRNKKKWVRQAGTNCPLTLKFRYVGGGEGNSCICIAGQHNCQTWCSGEWSNQRVHEHTDSCFGINGEIDTNHDITIEFPDSSCNDAMWVDRFFIPGGKGWGIQNAFGWCMGTYKHDRFGNALEFGTGSNKWVNYVNDECYKKIRFLGGSGNWWTAWYNNIDPLIQGAEKAGRRTLQEAKGHEMDQNEFYGTIVGLWDVIEVADTTAGPLTRKLIADVTAVLQTYEDILLEDSRMRFGNTDANLIELPERPKEIFEDEPEN